jgi:hypothetical protein
MIPVYIDEILQGCVVETSTALLASLQAIDANITGVHFQQGHPLEIQKAMQLLSEGDKDTKKLRYPAVWLFRDFAEKSSTLPGIYCEANIRLFIVTRTDPAYNAAKRKEVSFKPILYPILVELIKQIELSGKFLTEGEDLENFDRIDHYFWGRDGLFTKEGNYFTDWLDCIELNNFILKPYTKDC